MEPQNLLIEETINLSPPGIDRRRNSGSYSSSPEFEFWKIRNPSDPQPDLLSADELFVNGVLLPLDLISPKQPDPNHPPDPDPEAEHLSSEAASGTGSVPDSELGGPEISDSVTGLSASKRWRDIFRKDKGKTVTAKKSEEKEGEKGKEKEKKKERERKSPGQSAANPELNINIWPFSRSRSAGNSGTRPKMSGSMATRKVSSAPCSRSNSSGESKSKVKWPSSPGRAGVHLGRSSPVWQVRKAGTGPGLKTADGFTRNVEKSQGGASRNKMAGGGKARVLNLNVPMCIGYRNQLSCRSDESGAVGAENNVSGGGDGQSAAVGSGGSLFSIRNLFAKKVY